MNQVLYDYLIRKKIYLKDLIENSNNVQYHNKNKVLLIKDKLDVINATLNEYEYLYGDV